MPYKKLLAVTLALGLLRTSLPAEIFSAQIAVSGGQVSLARAGPVTTAQFHRIVSDQIHRFLQSPPAAGLARLNHSAGIANPATPELAAHQVAARTLLRFIAARAAPDEDVWKRLAQKLGAENLELLQALTHHINEIAGHDMALKRMLGRIQTQFSPIYNKAHSNPAQLEINLNRFFENSIHETAAIPATEPDPAHWTYDRATKELFISGEKAPFLDNGSIKRVYIHPNRSDKVIKIYDSKKLPGIFQTLIRHRDSRYMRRLHAAGLGPKILSFGKTANGVHYQESERVFGLKLDKKLSAGRLDDETMGLLRDLLQRLSDSRWLVLDLHVGNVMVGTTASNPYRQAYIIDADMLYRNKLVAGIVNHIANLIVKMLGMTLEAKVTDLIREPSSRIDSKPIKAKSSTATGAFLIIGMGLFAAYLWHMGPLLIADQLAKVGWKLPLVVLPFAIAIFADTWGWRFAILGQKPAGFFNLLALRLTAYSVGSLLPHFTMAKDVARIQGLRMLGVESASAIASGIIDGTTSTIAGIAFILIGLSLASLSLPAAGLFLTKISAGSALAVLALCAMVYWMRHGFFGPLLAAGRLAPFLRRWIHSCEDVLLKTDARLKSFFDGANKEFWLATLAHLLGWLSGAAEAWVLLHVLGAPVGMATALSIESLLVIVEGLTGFVPLNLGTVEISIVAIFSWLGIPPGAAIGFSILRRIRQAAWIGAGFALLGAIPRITKN